MKFSAKYLRMHNLDTSSLRLESCVSDQGQMELTIFYSWWRISEYKSENQGTNPQWLTLQHLLNQSAFFLAMLVVNTYLIKFDKTYMNLY
jgi:hypothetical protein